MNEYLCIAYFDNSCVGLGKHDRRIDQVVVTAGLENVCVGIATNSFHGSSAEKLGRTVDFNSDWIVFHAFEKAKNTVIVKHKDFVGINICTCRFKNYVFFLGIPGVFNFVNNFGQFFSIENFPAIVIHSFEIEAISILIKHIDIGHEPSKIIDAISPRNHFGQVKRDLVFFHLRYC